MRTALGTEPRLEKGAGSCGARLLENRCSVLELVVVMQRSVLSEGELAGLSRLYAHTPLSFSAQQLIQSWLRTRDSFPIRMSMRLLLIQHTAGELLCIFSSSFLINSGLVLVQTLSPLTPSLTSPTSLQTFTPTPFTSPLPTPHLLTQLTGHTI